MLSSSRGLLYLKQFGPRAHQGPAPALHSRASLLIRGLLCPGAVCLGIMSTKQVTCIRHSPRLWELQSFRRTQACSKTSNNIKAVTFFKTGSFIIVWNILFEGVQIRPTPPQRPQLKIQFFISFVHHSDGRAEQPRAVGLQRQACVCCGLPSRALCAMPSRALPLCKRKQEGWACTRIQAPYETAQNKSEKPKETLVLCKQGITDNYPFSLWFEKKEFCLPTNTIGFCFLVLLSSFFIFQ